MEQNEEMRENEEMRIFEQKWHYNHKWIITLGGSSVQLVIYPKPDATYGIKAFIYQLWVDEQSRGKGIGRRLLRKVEEIARAEGEGNVHLEWDGHDSPRWVYDWYQRNRYQEVSTSVHGSSLLCKRL